MSYPDASFMCVHDCNVSNVSFFFLGAVTFKKRKKGLDFFFGGLEKINNQMMQHLSPIMDETFH